ncbi:MAG: L-histidine N(alpha)-methyltransferase [Burkholderiales bacterium]|nr:L-histidine N(alpha)-methyltransferase [Burkholderiales bacterium]
MPQPLAAAHRDAYATDVYAGLTHSPQKELPSKYLYDSIGSSLFEVITHLPEYGLTRAEERILQSHADEMCSRVGPVGLVAELGSGSGRKTRLLLQACARHRPITYYPIEISPTALAQCEGELAGLASVKVVGLEHDYLQGLQEAAAQRTDEAPLWVLFLGSTIGNFSRTAAVRFLRGIRKLLRPGDALLFGADLEKPAWQLLTAYDDPLGVTASFNLNMLGRINRELGANFDLTNFKHEARINGKERAVEMHLRAMVNHDVRIPGAGLPCVTFTAGETIWTEISHKYQAEELIDMAGHAGFTSAGQWIDPQWLFAETLLRAT